MTTAVFRWSPRGIACRFYLPADGARAAVLLVGSLGAEHSWSYRGLRSVAEGLCDAGLAVLWCDYAGHGQSAGDLESGDPLTVVEDVAEAFTLLTATGLEPSGLITFGVGAAIAGTALAGQDPLDFAVHWEPATSGRRWLREQESLLKLTDAEHGGTRSQVVMPAGSRSRPADLPGLFLTDEQRAVLRRVKLADPGSVARRTLVLARADSAALASSSVPGAECVDALDTDTLLFGTDWPESSIHTIVKWVADRTPQRSPTPMALPGGLDPDSVRGSVREEQVWLGPDDLFAIRTAPVGGAPLPPIVLMSTSIEPGIGVGRLWVQLARALAQRGHCCYRVDVSGLGDSPERPDELRARSYSPHAVDDVLNAVHAVGDAREVVVIGMCSGSYHALEAGAREQLRAIYALNPILDHSAPGTGFQVAEARRPWLRRIENVGPMDWIRMHLPRAGWRLLHLTGVQRAPTAGLGRVVETGSAVRLFAGPIDGRRLSHCGGWLIDRYARSGRLRLELLDDVRHAVLAHDEREQSFAALLRAVSADLPLPPDRCPTAPEDLS